MSTKYPGGIITKNYVAPTPSSASGIWTLDQQQQAQQAGIWPFGGPFTFIEDVFSCFLYTGNSSTQTITNGIDLSTKGGLVWIKRRTSEAHYLFDTSRGVLVELNTDGQDGNQTKANSLTSFNTTGFSLGSFGGSNYSVAPDNSYVSWTFREQPKFFDVVTYTGTGSNRTVAHALGSVPASIWVKRTDTTSDWQVYHRSLANTEYLVLNSTAAKATGATRWNSTTPTSSVFSLGTDASVNASAGTYVAYIFAHDAGGFGLTGTDNVISCGSYTGIAYPNSLEVTIGFEPQFVIIKNSNTASDWTMWDIMRGMAVIPAANDAQAQILNPNTSAAESIQPGIFPTATGFVVKNGLTAISSPSDKMVYIAIRRGPMKVPTTGTSVFSPIAAVSGVQTTNFPVDMQILSLRDSASALLNHQVIDRLRGVSSTSTAQGNYLNTTSTAAESSANPFSSILMSNVGFQIGNNYAGGSGVFHSFQRAPSFMDVVCYTGTGVARTVSHNLAAVPELMIIKQRSGVNGWPVYSSGTGNTKFAYLDLTSAFDTNSSAWNNTSPTSSVFTVGSGSLMNTNAATYVAYLFATCAGVSKVGSYAGTGATQTIDCGFGAGGARFVLVKRTDSTGDWYVWDTARGMVAGTDPSLLLNTTGAEVNANSIYTIATGFQIVSTAAGINASGGTYIFLAIA